jgi:hypothetical protein
MAVAACITVAVPALARNPAGHAGTAAFHHVGEAHEDHP